MPRRPNVQLGDNYKEIEKVNECTIEQRLISKNPYIVLEEDNDIISNDLQKNSMSETEENVTDNNRKDLKHNSNRYYISVQEPAVEPPKKTATQHNLQNQMRTQLKWFVKEDNETYSIPMIINLQISRDKIRRVTIPRTLVQGGDKKRNMNGCSGKTISTSKSKMVILGDRQLKRSVPRTDNYLSSKFVVSGFIKPGADFESIVGKMSLGSSNKHVLICNGGANDVYNSNSKKVILPIMKFFQENDKTNIIMLDILHRYDLPDNSYVNKDSKTFNSKLKKYAK